MSRTVSSAELLEKVHCRSAMDARLIHLEIEPAERPVEDQGGRFLRFRLPLSSGLVNLQLDVSTGQYTLYASASDEDLARILRNVLLPYAELNENPREQLKLTALGPDPTVAQVLSALAGWGQLIQKHIYRYQLIAEGRVVPSEDIALVYWWDERANFGDTAGPWLVNAMTGRDVVNVRRTRARGQAVATIGSLFQMSSRNKTSFWGTGLLYPPTPGQLRRLKKLKSVSVHAVRGPKTRQVLQEQLGWDVPEIYGDPALLFPRYLPVGRDERETARIAFIPHRHHWKHFADELPSRVDMLSVADDVATVVRAIATASVCVSTSLHGVIFAQAYGVPWVWLNVEDDTLKGGDFKFQDFFATLHSADVAQVNVSRREVNTLDLEEVAAHATLPELRIDLDELEGAAPFLGADSPPSESGSRRTDQFDWSDIAHEDRLVAATRSLYRRQRALAKRASRGLRHRKRHS